VLHSAQSLQQSFTQIKTMSDLLRWERRALLSSPTMKFYVPLHNDRPAHRQTLGAGDTAFAVSPTANLEKLPHAKSAAIAMALASAN